MLRHASLQIFPISNAANAGTPTLGTVINLGAGSNLQTIAADRTSNIWLASINVTRTSVVNNVFVIAKNSNTVTLATGPIYAAGASGLNGMPRTQAGIYRSFASQYYLCRM